MKKQKDLIFEVTKMQFETLENEGDFTAMVEIGRTLNAFDLVMERVRELAADRNAPGYDLRQPNLILGRLVHECALLIGGYEKFYADEPHFQHLAEMFTGAERDIEPTPIAKLYLPEFRIYSSDPETAEALRDLDILGRDIVFNQSTPCPVIEAYEMDTDKRPGLYKVSKPKDNIERQVMAVLASFVQDFSAGAAEFINKTADHLGLTTRKPKRTPKKEKNPVASVK